MPTAEEISLNQQSLYDSAALRDDLNDAEATILLNWGEGQVARVANDYPEEFEQKNRFLRQLIKGINRFVGQREFNELEGQKEYLSKVIMYFPQLGWGHITEEALFAAMPADRKDMFGTLKAILDLLSPPAEANSAETAIVPNNTPGTSPANTGEATPNTPGKAFNSANSEETAPNSRPNTPGREITDAYSQSLENSNDAGITQGDSELNEE